MNLIMILATARLVTTNLNSKLFKSKLRPWKESLDLNAHLLAASHVMAVSRWSEAKALINDDLAPVPASRRTWSMWNIAALWVGMAICITTYTLASSLIEEGMSWAQAILTIFLGNLIVLIPMTLNAHPGTAYGIPFPVLIRSSFGTLGSNIPALMRALVASGWFGIRTWIGGAAIYAMAAIIFGFDSARRSALPLVGISGGELLCFLLFWAINLFVIIRGWSPSNGSRSLPRPS